MLPTSFLMNECGITEESGQYKASFKICLTVLGLKSFFATTNSFLINI
jgi:hypothetical protein